MKINYRYKTEDNDYSNELISQRRHRHQRQRTQITHSHFYSTPEKEFVYNKWYMKPSIRLKKPILKSQQYSHTNLQFIYAKLYDNFEQSTNKLPTTKNNDKSGSSLLQKISSNAVSSLNTFKKKCENNNRRVPKIIEVILKKKQEQKHQKFNVFKHRRARTQNKLEIDINKF